MRPAFMAAGISYSFLPAVQAPGEMRHEHMEGGAWACGGVRASLLGAIDEYSMNVLDQP
jgi:hypothetical protein